MVNTFYIALADQAKIKVFVRIEKLNAWNNIIPCVSVVRNSQSFISYNYVLFAVFSVQEKEIPIMSFSII